MRRRWPAMILRITLSLWYGFVHLSILLPPVLPADFTGVPQAGHRLPGYGAGTCFPFPVRKAESTIPSVLPPDRVQAGARSLAGLPSRFSARGGRSTRSPCPRGHAWFSGPARGPCPVHPPEQVRNSRRLPRHRRPCSSCRRRSRKTSARCRATPRSRPSYPSRTRSTRCRSGRKCPRYAR
jgi:hypothetical protein